jgi:hypothetical protein
VDQLKIVVAPDDVGGSLDRRAEPILNGVSLVDLFKRAEHRPAMYVGLPLDELTSALRRAAGLGLVGQRIMVLSCSCGDPGCGHATMRVRADGDSVIWDEFKVPREPTAAAYAGLGPFRFAADDYEAALTLPVVADEPVRDRAALDELARGLPANHRAWLDRLYIETDGDAFHVPRHTRVALAGLQAFAAAGDPLTVEEAVVWAQDKGFVEHNIGAVAGFVRAANIATHS